MQKHRRGLSVCSVGFMVSSQQVCFPLLPLPQAILSFCVRACAYVCVSAKDRDFDLTAKLTTASE